MSQSLNALRVASLPDTNWLKKNPNMMTGDMTDMGDSGVTDLLLHHCDHAYRVPELLHFLKCASASSRYPFPWH